MTDINKPITISETESTKLKELCHSMIRHADAESEKIITDARDEMESWCRENETALEAERAAIADDAKKRAAAIASRQISDAKNNMNRERLKLQTECVEEARLIFQKKLDALSERKDYPKVLAGLAVEAIDKIPAGQNLKLKLSSRDAPHAQIVIEMLGEIYPSAVVELDPIPGAFCGGVAVSSENGRWNIISDWAAKSDEMADTIANRVLAAL